MIYAVYHLHGVSLIRANGSQAALKTAERIFGTAGGPYRLPDNQEQEVEWAKAMGATILGAES